LFNLSNADSNSIINCKFILPVSSSSNWESINAASCNGLLVDSVSIKGGYAGVTLMGVSGNADYGNVIRNSVFDSLYNGAISCWYQFTVKIQKNTLTTIGNGTNTYVVGILVREGQNGYLIEKNKISGIQGGTAIQTVFSTAVDGRSVIANNMIKAGVGTNPTLALRAGSDNNDIIYNTVEVNASNNGSGFCLFVNGSGSNNILNNILKNTNQGSIFQVSATNLFLNNNCYYHNNMQNFPYMLNGTSHATLASLKAAGTNDTASVETDPLFISSTNLRTNNPILNNRGYAFSGINTDIDDSTRSLTTPDIGVNEYNLPDREDAGITGITLPSVPVSQGALSDVVVVIKNHGVGTLTSTIVTYRSGSTTYTLPYTGSLAEGQSDTVRFLVSASQGLQIPLNGGFTVNAWTSLPNGVADNDHSNDTMKKVYCEPMSGVYTINAGGSGARNFVSFNEAVKALTCGGISAAVTFEAATGTYNERVAIPGIPGANSARTITFTSASGVSSDVLLTDSSTHDTNNYVILFAGTNNVYVKNMSVSNRGTDYSRVFSYKVTNSVLNERIYVKYCNVSARVAASNSINTALFYAGSEDNKDLYVINNQISNGSAGIYFAGLPLKNQYSNNVVIDSNTFLNNAYNGIVLTYRNGFDINRNTIQSSSAAMVNGISLYEVSGNVSLRQNQVNLVQGSGIRFNRYAFYNETGSAYVTSNAVLLGSTADVAQMGLGLMSSSKVYVYNNTIRTNSSKTATFASYTPNYGVYVQAEPVASNLQNVAPFDIRMVNNIIQAENGYPLYIDDVAFGTGVNQMSRLAIAEINNNLYHNTNGTNIAFVVNTSYAKTNFDAFKDVIRTNSDSISRYVKVPFAAGSLKPLESDTIAWWINGRALHNAQVAKDVTGKTRATIPYNGVPDIGAYEITPTSVPPLAVAIPATPLAGSTQVFVFLGDTVAKIHYEVSGTVPASAEARQYVGERPPLVSANQKFMYSYVSIEMPAGAYNYHADVIYKDAWTGTMSINEADIRMTSQDALGNWTMLNTSSVDVVNNTISGLYLFANSYVLTGTDPAAPLPVKLTSFAARRSGTAQIELNWKTASERNVSHYIIERSPDGVNFENAGKVAAHNAPSTYRFIDDVRTGVQAMYYRLLITDRDGSQSGSKVVKVVFDDSKAAAITLAPNPVNTNLNIQLGMHIDEQVTVSVYSLQGQKISEQTYQSVSGISQNAAALKAGLYFVKVAYGDVVKTIRFVKD
ncbi:MAG: T9SS type A sorting domain-containing protein, partial [Bacteroidota bacterium]